PYAVNEFLRSIESPFDIFADVDGGIAKSYDLLVEREGMANVSTARRSVFVLDGDKKVTHKWVADDWISPVPADEIEEGVEKL
ncbi:MAG: redoxin domain-containing protein, partial [Halobacteria archaeon]|nr:redoxin domain-containing protein [Halobacteria archaeon]